MDIIDETSAAIASAIPGARVNVRGGGGHFEIEVVSDQFAGKRILERQRMVLGAIAHLMKGDMAPIHAVDTLICNTP